MGSIGGRWRVTGEYQHSVDSKGRLFMPSRLREELGESFMVCKGLGGCLFVYSQENWGNFEKKVNSLPLSQSIQMQRTVFPTAYKCVVDAQGRILLTQKLREYAGIEKNVTVIGLGNHAEIWSSDKWDQLSSGCTEEVMAAAMDSLGF